MLRADICFKISAPLALLANAAIASTDHTLSVGRPGSKGED